MATDSKRERDRRSANLATMFVVSAGLFLCLVVGRAVADDSIGLDFFERKIRPVLTEHCLACHSGAAAEQGKLKGGLRLDQREAALRGGDSGQVIVPGKPEESLLIAAIRYESPEMPPSGRLATGPIDDFVEWIRIGAPWPQDPPSEVAPAPPVDYDDWRSRHWAWRPVESPPLPAVRNMQWSSGPVDRFVLAQLDQVGLDPSPPADRATLFRRLHFGLLGLPPVFEDVQAFVHDESPDAYERVVDRLLTTPTFGERAARHWLDVARYADNAGWNSQTKELYSDFHFAYTYRDYVVRAFNDDLPYDRFLVEQLAADKLDLGADNRPLAALGFLTLGDKSFGNNYADRVDDCIDTVTRGMLATTVSCARCHDHKYDPISTADYYSLFGIFDNSTIDVAFRVHELEKCEVFPPLFSGPAERRAFEAELDRSQQELAAAEDRCYAASLAHCLRRAGDYMLAAAKLGREERRQGLHAEIVAKWREYLKRADEEKRPAFGPWHVLVKLAQEPAADKFSQALEQLLARPDELPANRLVIEELRRQAPRDIEQVADAYTHVFSAARDRAGAAGPVAAQVVRATQAVATMVRGRVLRNDDAELLTVLYGQASPLQIDRQLALRLPIDGQDRELARLRKAARDARFGHPRAVALADKATLVDAHVYVRGNPQNRGPVAPRRFLPLLSPAGAKAFTEGSGRLELARAIADPSNPLTRRVIVNRIWQQHFGRGLVESAGDFGTRSDAPSHPQLLDHLATRLLEDGWSLKQLHQRIVQSEVYRQTSLTRPELEGRDPGNRWLARVKRGRLDFESLRDSLLAVSGELDTQVAGRPVPAWESRRRTIYGYVNRYRIADGYLTFDYPNPSRTASERQQTLVPQQALFLMNSPFVTDRSAALTDRRDFLESTSDARRIELLYRWILSRVPDPAERIAAEQFLTGADHRASAAISTSSEGLSNSDSSAWRQLAQALLLSNEFVYVD